MKTLNTLICLAFFSLVSYTSNAQTANSFLDARVLFKPLHPVTISTAKADTLSNFKTIYSATDTMDLSLLFDLQKITNIDSIKVQLGTSAGNYNLVNQKIGYDQLTGLPAGISYKRNGSHFIIGLGNHLYFKTYHAKIEIQDLSGNTISKTIK